MKTILYVCYLAVTVLGLFAAVEGGLRLADYQPEGRVIPRFFADLPGDFPPGLRLRDTSKPDLSHQVTTNSLGMRSERETTVEKPEGVLRVLCLGDSFTYGAWVDDKDTYPAQLQREPDARYPGRRIEVLNAGISATGVLDAMDYYVSKGRNFRPDVVVVQFFPNDIQDITGYVPYREAYAYDPVYTRRNALQRLLAGTRLYQIAEQLRTRWAAYSLIVLPHSEKPKPHNPAIDPYRFSVTDAEKEFLNQRERLLGGATRVQARRAWDAYGQGLLALCSMVRADGAQPLVLNVPDLLQVINQLPAVEQEMGALLARGGIPGVDMLLPFRHAQYVLGVSPYLTPLDDHCSPYGNRLLACAVADRLTLVGEKPGSATLEVTPGAPALPWEGPVSAEVFPTLAGGPLGFVCGQGLSGRVAASSGLTVEGETSVPIDVLRPADEGGDAGHVVMEFESAVPLSHVELRVPCRMPLRSGKPARLRVEISCDGVGWRTLLDQTGGRSERDGGFENFYLLDSVFGTEAPRRFQVRLSIAGDARLYAERRDVAQRTRVWAVTAYPAAP